MEVLVSVSELFGEGRNQAVVHSSTTRPFISCFVRHLSFFCTVFELFIFPY